MNEDAFVDLVLTIGDLIDNYINIGDHCYNVYHYASFEGTLSITGNFSLLNGGSVLYHTLYSCLSDCNEGKEAYPLYLKAVEKYVKNKGLENSLYDLLLSIEPNDVFMFYDSDGPNIDRAYTERGIAYICCFSREQDSKELWNIYLKGAKSGYALGYNLSNLISDSKNYFGNNYRHMIKSVLYKEDEKINYIYNFLDTLLSKTTNPKYIKYYVQTFINANKFVFKNEKLSFENEVRSIIVIPKSRLVHFNLINDGKTYPYKYDWGSSIDSVTFYCEEKPTFLENQILKDCDFSFVIITSKYAKL